MPSVLVVGLNPAWQKVMEFDALHPGEVNRARSLMQLASGKGMNAAKVLKRLGHDVFLLQILGGENGRRCARACAELKIRSLQAEAANETRQCLTLLEGNGRATEIIEPFSTGVDAGPALWAALPPRRFDALVISGSVPEGGPADFYDRLAEKALAPLSILDSAHPVSAATLERMTCVKVNRKEFTAMPPVARKGVLCCVTDGPAEAAMLRGEKTLARFSVPALPRAVNPIGAGDTVTAALTHFLLRGEPPEEAFRKALATGSASCLQAAPAEYDESDYARLLPEVKRHG